MSFELFTFVASIRLERMNELTDAAFRAAFVQAWKTVRGFVSILGSKGGERIESAKNDTGERTYRIAK